MKRLMDRIGETVKRRIAEAGISPSEDEIRKYILEEWREKNPEFRCGEIYLLDNALEHGKTIFGDFLK